MILIYISIDNVELNDSQSGLLCVIFLQNAFYIISILHITLYHCDFVCSVPKNLYHNIQIVSHNRPYPCIDQ